MGKHDPTQPNRAEAEDNRPDMPPLPASEYLHLSWNLNAVQEAFLSTPARFAFYVGGVGAGKTTAGAIRAIRRASVFPGSLGLIGAPTYPMLHDATARTFFAILPPSAIAAYHKAAGHLILSNGAEILFRSLDEPDSVRGLNLAWFWLDEAPLAGYYAWKILKGRLRQRGFSTAAWATGTPRGRDGFWRDFEEPRAANPPSRSEEPRAANPPSRSEEGRRPSHALFRASTRVNAENLPPNYIAELGYRGAFALQEIEGLFVAFQGLVYTFDASPGQGTQQGHLRAPRPDAAWSDVIGGIDWGYANPTAALVFGLDGDGRAWQLDEFYQRRAGLEDVVLPAVLDLTRRYHVRRWYCGPDEPEHITALAAALARDGLPALALKADNAVRAGIQTVTGLLAPRPDGTRGLYVAPRCVHTIAEFGSYQYEQTETSTGRSDDESGRA
ncbi:MAG TPA: terminase family protein, partial [Ktedonobacterales bacterium]|nr:terminase family protein [Ktedonobacterales bacterium]